MLAMRLGAVAAVVVGVATIGWASYSSYSALDLVEIGVSAQVKRVRSGKSSATLVTYAGKTYGCNGGGYATGTPVFVDPQRPWRCRSKDDLGALSVFELTLISVGFFLILAAIATFVFEAFATDSELERFEM
ncbi:MAG: hypothetical protein AB8H79_02245 [Myxococcota bacterium]